MKFILMFIFLSHWVFCANANESLPSEKTRLSVFQNVVNEISRINEITKLFSTTGENK